jgi:uncharacterized protein
MQDNFTSAVRNGNAGEVRRLIDQGADVNQVSADGAYTPLIEAAYRNRQEVVELLLAHGAKVNVPSANGWTALMSAAWEGHTAIVRLLLGKGANRALKNSRGDTALSLAEAAGNGEVVALLRAK